jgi:hypothetical protein
MQQITTVHLTQDLERITQCPTWTQTISDSEAPGIFSVMERFRGAAVCVFLPPIHQGRNRGHGA